MKVNIYETVEISDEQRVTLARRLDGAGAKKRQATREEIKTFVWVNGSRWEAFLGDDPELDLEPDEDLVGDTDEEDLLG